MKTGTGFGVRAILVGRQNLNREEELKKNRLLKIPGVVNLILTVVVLLLVGCAQQAPAPPAEPETATKFYANNVVTIICPYAPGGGTDYAARLFASYWSTYVEGGLMKVKNVEGGGGIVGANEVYRAKPDGLTLGIAEAGSGLLAPVIFGNSAVKYDLAKFNFIGVVGTSPGAMAVSVKAPYELIEDLRGVTGFTFAAYGVNSDTAIGAAIVSDILGMKDTRLVPGYWGTAEIGLALAKGEVDGGLDSSAAIMDMIEKGFVKPKAFVVISFARSEWFPDVPAIAELAELNPEQEKELRIAVALQSAKPFFTTPGVPQDRVDFVRDVFTQIVADKGFLKQMKLRWKVWESPMSGVEYAEEVRETMAIPSEDIARLQESIQNMTQL